MHGLIDNTYLNDRIQYKKSFIFNIYIELFWHLELIISFCLLKQNILKAKSNFTLLLYTPFLGIGEWYFKCV